MEKGLHLPKPSFNLSGSLVLGAVVSSTVNLAYCNIVRKAKGEPSPHTTILAEVHEVAGLVRVVDRTSRSNGSSFTSIVMDNGQQRENHDIGIFPSGSATAVQYGWCTYLWANHARCGSRGDEISATVSLHT